MGLNTKYMQEHPNVYIGTLGVEWAAGYWGLCSYNTDMPIFLIKDAKANNLFIDNQISYLFDSKINNDNVSSLSDTLYVTSPEQTVCDMIRYKRHDFHLYETIDSSTWTGIVDSTKLNKLLESYGLTETYNELVMLADTAYNEDA